MGRAKAGDRAAAVTNTIELGLYFLNNMLALRPTSVVDDSVPPDSGMAGRSAKEKRQQITGALGASERADAQRLCWEWVGTMH